MNAKKLFNTLFAGALLFAAGCASDSPQRTAGQAIDDQAVARRVEEALRADPAYKFTEVKVVAYGGKVQLGGGIRTVDAIERWLGLGVARVVIGTAALENPDLVRQAARDNPGRIVVAVDARDGLVATRGWADVSDVRVEELARQFEDVGVAAADVDPAAFEQRRARDLHDVELA